MKNIILIFITVIILVVIGGVVVYANIDTPIFDRFFPQEVQEQRDLDRMVKLYPETIGQYSLYSWGADKIRKESGCEDVNETINRISGNLELKGEICNRYTIGQYRMQGSDKVVFVHIFKMTKGKEIIKNILLNMSLPEKRGDNYLIRPERHELGWITDSGVDYILTQEGTFKTQPDGGESMNYSLKATGENAVTQYFMSKYLPAKLSSEELKFLCLDSDEKDYKNSGSVEGIYFDSIKNEARREKVKDVCVGDRSFSLQDKDYYIEAGIITKEESINKNILMEAYCQDGFIKISTYECLNGCQDGACLD